MTWTATAGSTLMLPSGAGFTEHIHFVLNDPLDFQGYAPQSCMLVWASTITKEGAYDQSCPLADGCHPFINRPSYVPFAMVDIRPAADLEKRVAEKIFRASQPVDITFIRRLVSSLIASPRASRLHKKFANQVWDELAIKYPP